MDLKKPKSGIFINPKKIEPFGTELPFQDYNPRIIQNRLDTGHCGLYDIDQPQQGQYTWFDNTVQTDAGKLSPTGKMPY